MKSHTKIKKRILEGKDTESMKKQKILDKYYIHVQSNRDQKELKALNKNTSKFGLKDIICRDKTIDIFKDLLKDNCD